MKTSETTPIGILSVLAIGFFLLAPAVSAQNHVVAIGKVNADGTLANSANTVTGVVASLRNGEGDYTVTITATGAFAGTTTDDFVGEVTVEDNSFDDQVAKIGVSNVTDDVLTLLVHIDDVEDNTDTNVANPNDDVFFFSVYRIPAAFPAVGSTKFLIGAAKVNTAGTFVGGTGVDGIVIASVRLGEGDYEVTLTKAGAFAGTVIDDYVLQACLNDTGTQDDAIRAEVTGVTDDVLTINVRTDDIQDETNDTLAVPADDTFHLLVYQIQSSTGLAASKFLVAMGRVAGATGTLTSGGAFDGSAVGSTRDAEGRYTVTITSPGAFINKEDNQYVIHLAMNATSSRDEVIEGDIDIPDGNTLTLEVTVNDGEQAGGNAGVADDENFYFLIYDAGPHFQPDLHIGRKKNLTTQIGDDIHNKTAVGQRIKLRLKGIRKRGFFFTLENDGNLRDSASIKAKRSGSALKAKYFRISNGRKNVTAALLTGNFLEENMAPCRKVRFKGQLNYKSASRHPKKTLRFKARSQSLASELDTNKAKVR